MTRVSARSSSNHSLFSETLKLTSPSPILAFDMLAKKSGHSVDRNTSEKITDGAREAYEKATGKTVNPKFSN